MGSGARSQAASQRIFLASGSDPVSVRATAGGPKITNQLMDATSVRGAGNGKGLLLMGLGMFLFAGADTIAKLLTGELHPFQIVWTRQLGLLVGALFLLALHGRRLFRTAHPEMQVVRGVVAALSAAAFVFAVRHVPLADAVAVSFVAPFMVTLMAALILGEPVGWRRWVAVSLGFAGSMAILRPGMGAVHPAAMLVVAAAFFFACRQIISRAIAGSDRTGTTMLYTATTAVLVLSLPLPWVWAAPSGSGLLLLAGMALLAGLAEVCVIRALETGLAAVVAPMHYTLIIWATLYGWLVFGHFPDGWTWSGAAIITATGLYTLRRERLAAGRHAAEGMDPPRFRPLGAGSRKKSRASVDRS